MTYKQCIANHQVSRGMIANFASTFVNSGIDSVLKHLRNINSDHANRKVDGRTEACLIKISCGPVPEGHSRWTIQLLEKQMKVKLEEPIRRKAIRRTLKNQPRPHRSDYWCLPAKGDAEFVACMEDVLNIYKMPYNYMFPVVYLYEKPYQLLGEAIVSWAMGPGDTKKSILNICAMVPATFLRMYNRWVEGTM